MWPFKKKQKETEQVETIENPPKKTTWTQTDIVEEAKELLYPKTGIMSYYPNVWAQFIIKADKRLKELEEENEDLKQRLQEYKQELASYHL